MSTSPFAGPVAVTGATGYVAGHVVRELLQRGATVHATARDPSNEAKVAHLKLLHETLPGTLKLFAADLIKPGSFAEAIEGCDVVLHTASPFSLSSGDPYKDVVEPAVEGTRNVLQTVNETASVTRVVLTSSIAAVNCDGQECADRGGQVDESHWNEVASVDYEPYAFSKTEAERAAWKIAEAQDRWRLVAVNPGFVMGPSLTSRNDSTSISYLIKMVDGSRGAIWEAWTPWVDVRDVAFAHAEAAVRPDAEGRHILSAECLGHWTVGLRIKAACGERAKTPWFRVPRWLAFLVAPLNGYSRQFVRRHVERPLAFDNRRSIERLGVNYRPLDQTFKDHFDQLVRDGLVNV